jgi:hypothetical protein
LGVFGREYSASKSLSDTSIEEIMKDVKNKLKQAKLEGDPQL